MPTAMKSATPYIKEGTIVVKTDSGSLIGQVNRIERNEIQNVIKKIDALKALSEASGAYFLYCSVPSKDYMRVHLRILRTTPKKTTICFYQN